MRKLSGMCVVVLVLGVLALPAGAAPPESPPGQAPITPPARPAAPGQPTDPGSGNPGSPVEVSVADETVGEDDGTAEVTISLSATSSFDTVVNWATADGTATAGTDYTASGGTAVIPSGTTGTTVSVPVTDDTDAEGDEVFTVTLSNPSGNATIADGAADVTIVDDDTATGPTLSVDDATVIEGLEALVTIRLSEPATETVHVSGQVHQGTATFFDDIVVSGFSTGILTGQDQAVVSLPTFRSDDAEPETFTVVISSSTTTVADDTAEVTIVDDPQAGNTSCTDDAFEPNEHPGEATETSINQVLEARACPDDNVDFYSIEQLSGATVNVEVVYDTSLADLDVVLLHGENDVATGQQFTDEVLDSPPDRTCPRDDTTSGDTSIRTGECLSYSIPFDPLGPLSLVVATPGPPAGVPYQVFISYDF